MTRPPDQLPQSARDREKRIAVTRGDTSSTPGRTRFSGRVASNPAAAARAVSRGSSSNSDRLSVFKTFLAAALTGTSAHIGAWDGTADFAGESIQLNSPDDGGLYLFTAGQYAITTSLKIDGIDTAAASWSLLVLTGAAEFPNLSVCKARGGDKAGGSWVASASQTYFSDGRGFSGGTFVDLRHVALDPAIVSVSVQVDVALVSR